MEYGTKYLTFAEYQGLGGSITDENAFNLLEYQARRSINSRTQNRLIEIDTIEIPTEVKVCAYNLINKINTINEQKYNVSSETVGSYSVSYGSIQEAVNANTKQIDNIIREGLLGVIVDGEHILYRGI